LQGYHLEGKTKKTRKGEKNGKKRNEGGLPQIHTVVETEGRRGNKGSTQNETRKLEVRVGKGLLRLGKRRLQQRFGYRRGRA